MKIQIIDIYFYIWVTNKPKTIFMSKKTISIISYITIIGWIIAFLVYNNETEKSSLAKFHLKQSLGLGILGILNFILEGVVVSFAPSASMASIITPCGSGNESRIANRELRMTNYELRITKGELTAATEPLTAWAVRLLSRRKLSYMGQSHRSRCSRLCPS